ncbi:GNAT family N-acetyltransferase [Planococcus soli]|uniref:GNAT family N-acetyltransferase n=1 Tax=Planococcus soli TaxID=2666072 RepID=UPI00115DE818|nr:GNAT family protein [Planococcus soli]
MIYKFQPMSQDYADEIANRWRYDGIYSFYNMDADQEDLQEFLNPTKREDSYFVVINKREIIGFYSFREISDGIIDIGLGMKPSLTGQGSGFEFVKAGLDFANSTYILEKFTLSVATFNTRAINVYKKVGFKEYGMYIQATNGSSFEFLKMIYEFKE